MMQQTQQMMWLVSKLLGWVVQMLLRVMWQVTGRLVRQWRLL